MNIVYVNSTMTKPRVLVEEFTTPNPITAPEDALLDELFRLMKKHEIRHLPIVRNKRIVGIVSDRDLRVASGLNTSEKNQIRAGDIMATDPVTVNAGDTLDAVAFEMSEKKIGCVIVNDGNDNLLGIFTATDALNALIETARQAAQAQEVKNELSTANSI